MFGLFGGRPKWVPSVKYDMTLDISATYGMAGEKRPGDSDLIFLQEIDKPKPSFVNKVGGNKMTFRMDWNGARLFEHEFGHLIGAEDFYIQNKSDGDDRSTVPYNSGWNGNLMADRGTKLDWKNVEDILRFHGKKLQFNYSVEQGGVKTQDPLPNAAIPQQPTPGSFR